MVPQVTQAAPKSVILVVTDPRDPLADLTLGLGHKTVLSTGTYLDSLRFRFHVARRFQVNPESVEAMVVGEHGTSQVFLWSSARIGGRPISAIAKDKSGMSFNQFKNRDREGKRATRTLPS